MDSENYPLSVSQQDAAACYEEQLLLQYDHYLLKGIAALGKAKSRFNTVLLSHAAKTGMQSQDQQELQQKPDDPSQPETFPM